MKYIILSFALGLCACAHVNTAFEKGGTQYYEAVCSGALFSMSDCYREASEKCRGDFEEFSHEQHGMSNNRRSMIFSCKPGQI